MLNYEWRWSISHSHVIQSQTPATIKAVPIKANPILVSSPKSVPNKAVAANVVALVTGTASDIGESLSRAKKVADAERFRKKGTEYCQKNITLSKFWTEERSLWWSFGGFGEEEDNFRDRWSHRSAPRRNKALVAPQTRPTATIFSISLAILVPAMSPEYWFLRWAWR